MSARVSFVALLIAVVATTSAAQDRRIQRADSGGRRLALVVGNNTYASVPLVNAVNDARAVDAAMRDIGFESTLVTNATLEAMDRAVDAFVARVQPGDVALFYYSGHGVQVGGQNYLIPVDFKGGDAVALRRRTASVTELQERLQLQGAKVRILILDACRDNPFAGTRSASQGLAGYNAEGALIAYATAEGKTASDNASGTNGLFTTHFLKALKTPGLPVSELFRQIRQSVRDASNGQQFPWVSDGLIGDFSFVPARDSRPSTAPATSSSSTPSVPASRAAAVGAAVEDAVKSCYSGDTARFRLLDLQQHGNQIAAMRIAESYWYGSCGFPRDRVKSRSMTSSGLSELEAFAAQGIAEAQFLLGRIYEAGRAKEHDVVQAAYWYEKAAEQGHGDSLVRLGFFLRVGIGIKKDEARALGLMQRAASLNQPEAFSLLGSWATDIPDALDWYKKAFDRGYVEAYVRLGGRYLYGFSPFPKDGVEARRWFDKVIATAPGSLAAADAMHSIGRLYATGNGVAASDTDAFTWFNKAAAAGDILSMVEVGDCYRDGRGTTRNDAVAFNWYRQAADLDSVAAMSKLGMMLAQGRGAPTNEAGAIEWWQKAARLGSKDAQTELTKRGKSW
jgi:TPR repeat protein